MKRQVFNAISPLAFVALALGLLATSGRAQDNSAWTEPFPPYRIIGNVYYVGSRELASYLITTNKGHILINSGLETSPLLIRASVEKLGFKFGDVKVLLISQAHFDHAAGSSAVKQMTGAKYLVMNGDADVVESGGRTDFQYGNIPAMLYPPTQVDRLLHDGDKVRLGGVTLIAHLTAGHTKGTTTWTLRVIEGGKPYDVVIVGGLGINSGYRLFNNTSYPNIADDYENAFRTMRSLPCDVFLGAHGSYFDMEAKYARLKPGGPDPFIDRQGYLQFLKQAETTFRKELQRQRVAGK